MRCYFEWEHLINAATGKAKTGDEYMIQPKGSAVTWLAGLYRIEDISGIQVPVFTILTREPSEEIRFIHDRMPVILSGDDIEKWIDPVSKPDEIIKNAMTDMVFEKIIA
ncbi:MAG: SOS response-associated peptidase [Clostridiales bacterium]|nr:SOS response-associated peptidase [Clostridiales bacterium]